MTTRISTSSIKPIGTPPVVEYATGVPFRFDAGPHAYYVDGVQIPSITQLLERDGLGCSPYAEGGEGAERGRDVHALTAAYDLGGLELASCTSPHRGYLLAHAKAMEMLRPEIVAVEEPRVHSVHRFGGRTDRVWVFEGRYTVCDEKTGGEEAGHSVQTSLQSILEAERWGVDPRTLGRYCLYLTANGRARLIEHTRERDFDRAYRILRKYCR